MVKAPEKPPLPKPTRFQRDARGSMVTVGSCFFVLSIVGIAYALIVAGHVPILFIIASVVSAVIVWLGYRNGGRFLDTMNDDGDFPEERGPWRWF